MNRMIQLILHLKISNMTIGIINKIEILLYDNSI